MLKRMLIVFPKEEITFREEGYGFLQKVIEVKWLAVDWKDDPSTILFSPLLNDPLIDCFLVAADKNSRLNGILVLHGLHERFPNTLCLAKGFPIPFNDNKDGSLFECPDDIEAFTKLVSARILQNSLTHSVQQLKERMGLKNLIGESPRFLEAVRLLPLVARCDIGVFITGETGTGKEEFARSIHYLSKRSGKPFVAVNCGAVPTELFENEFFGHETGAFTGALGATSGYVGEANGGTLFLDEIDCLPKISQIKLLRFLQAHEYKSLGSSRIVRSNVRVIAAANVDIEKAVQTGDFRKDLYYRLNGVPLNLPPLREHRTDIPLLAQHFVEKYRIEFDRPDIKLSTEAVRVLETYDWPGNIRELEHTIERAIVLSEEPIVRPSEILLPFPQPDQTEQISFAEAKANMIARFERTYLHELLVTHQGNITKAAVAAQKNRRVLAQLIRKHRIDVPTVSP